MEKTYYVYILICGDGSLYTGMTDDVPRRVLTHNAGKGAKYTRSRLPVQAAYVEPCPDKSAALRREMELKRLSHGEKAALIAHGHTEE